MIRVFGITGTNGKTTVSWMLRNILEQKGPCGLIGTIEYIIKDVHHAPKNTTPGKELLKELMDEMEEKSVGDCVMEVSSHGIHQGRISDVEFFCVGFTNLSRDHLDYHKTMEEYYRVKKKLFFGNARVKVVNTDDEYGRRLYDELIESAASDEERKKIKSYSLKHNDADFYGDITEFSAKGIVIDVYEGGVYLGNLKVSIPGEHFAYDAMLAMAMARTGGMGFEDIEKAMASMPKVPGRMERIGSPEDTLGIVDYAHTPDSLEQLLRTVSTLCRGKVICVFGCGGFRDKGKRQQMGRIAGMYSDHCIITNDNPRGEPPENIAAAIEEGLRPTGCEYSVILDRFQAVKRAVSLADKWDIIVVAGKGHENYQISGSEKIPFNDGEVLKELLEKKYETTYNESDSGGHRRSADIGQRK